MVLSQFSLLETCDVGTFPDTVSDISVMVWGWCWLVVSDSSFSFLPRSVSVSVFFLSLLIFDDFLSFPEHSSLITLLEVMAAVWRIVVLCVHELWYLHSSSFITSSFACRLDFDFLIVSLGGCYICFVLFCSCLAVFFLYLICLLWVLFVKEYSIPLLISLLYNPLVACLLLLSTNASFSPQ